MATFKHHEPCPKCKSRDNLAVYSDGGKYCFGCGFSVRSSVSGFVKDYQQQEEEKTWSLPDDLTQDFPPEVLTLIQKYSLTVEELIKYAYYFSRRTGRLWRLFRTGLHKRDGSSLRGSCGSAEARQLFKSNGTNAAKNQFYGSKEDTFAFAGTEHQSKHLVIVEDGFSSIKVGRVAPSLPLFGTSISPSKLSLVAQQFEQVTVWLDHDKFKEAWAIANRFKWLGLLTNVVLTPLDPKCYTEEEIKHHLNVTKV